MTLLASHPGGQDAETDLHRQFAHLRVAGEWFRAEADLLEHVERLQHSVEAA